MLCCCALIACCCLGEFPLPRAYAADVSEENGKVLAYLVELFRRQNKPCSEEGQSASVLPSLTYSDRLADALRSSAQSGRNIRDVFAARQILVEKYALLYAPEPKAPDAFATLKNNACLQLMQPYTHIGAVFANNQWQVVMANMRPAPKVNNGTQALQAATPAPESRIAAPAPSLTMNKTLPAPNKPETAAAESSPPEAKTLLQLINTVRAKGASCGGKEMAAAQALTERAPLHRAAQQHVEDMAAFNYFSSVSPSGTSMEQRLQEEKYAWNFVTELIAKGPPPISAILDLWLANPSQCSQIMEPLFSEAGIGYAEGYWGLFLAAPAEEVPASP